MTLSPVSQKKISAYLAALRRQLPDLLEEDVKDIVEEIRAHILDKTADGASEEQLSATLTALGSPEELASRYRTEELLQRAKMARSPAYLMRSLARWATISVVGLLVFLISLLGYSLGAGLVILGLLKLTNPHHTGVWGKFTEHDWSLGFQSGGQLPQGTHELFGWWLVPIGLIIGSGLLFLTFRLGNWSIRKFWRPRIWQEI